MQPSRDDAASLPRVSPARAALNDREEARLMARVAVGDLRAFDSLYRAYHPRLTRFVDRMTRRPALAGEVLNDTLLVVWHRAGSFNGSSKVSTWIFGIAYRKALKALSRLDLPLEDADADAQLDPGPNPEQQLALAQVQARLQRALSGLSADHRAVVDLCYFHGMAYADIAQVVGCPPETVKTRMFYARRRLRLLLADLDDAAPGAQA